MLGNPQIRLGCGPHHQPLNALEESQAADSRASRERKARVFHAKVENPTTQVAARRGGGGGGKLESETSPLVALPSRVNTRLDLPPCQFHS